MDVNRVFDTINVAAKPAAITLAAAKITAEGATAKEFPGETALMEFTVTFATWAKEKKVAAGWNLKLMMSTQSKMGNNRVQGAGDPWVKHPKSYDEWKWGTKCTNTQWGIDDADLTAPPAVVTLKNKTPACAVTTTTDYHTMTIPIAEELTSTDYTTFKVKFQIDVTMPSDLLAKAVNVEASIMDAANYHMIAKTASAITMLAVTKPAGQNNNQAKALLSWGVEADHADTIARGGGIYSSVFCLATQAKAGVAGAFKLGHSIASNCDQK
jgi:hypothetical protein